MHTTRTQHCRKWGGLSAALLAVISVSTGAFAGPASSEPDGASPIETIAAEDLEARRILIVRGQGEGQGGANVIPPGVAVYSVPTDREHKSSESIRGPDDLSARYALAYGEKGLHLYVDVTDDVVYTGKDYLSLTPIPSDGMYNCDSIQVCFDQGLDRTSAWDENDQEIGFSMNAAQDAGETYSWTTFRQPSPGECAFRVARTERGYFVDALYSWGYLDKIDRVGKRAFGFNIIVNDNDGAGRKGWIYLGRGIGDAKHTEDSAIAILDDGKPNVIGLFSSGYVGRVSAPLLLWGMDGLSGRSFDVLAGDKGTPGKSVLLRPVTLAGSPGSVGYLPIAFDPAAFSGDVVSVRAMVDGQPIQELEVRRIRIRESLDEIDREISALGQRIDALERQGRCVGYPRSKLAVLSSQTMFAKDNLHDYETGQSRYYLGKAMRRVREIQSLLKLANEEASALSEGKIPDRFKTYRYVTSPVVMKDGYPCAKMVDDSGQVAERPMVLNGYCMGIDWNIDSHVEEGKARFVKESGEVVEVTGPVGRMIDQPALANSSMSFLKNLALLKQMGGNAFVEICKPTWSCLIYDLSYPPNFGQSEDLYKLAKGIEGPFYYNSFRDRFSELCQSAASNDFLVTCNFWAISFPAWVLDKYPEMRFPPDCGGGPFGWFNYQINTPGARKVLGMLARNLVREIREDPHGGSVHSFDIANETAFADSAYNIPIQRAMFLDHLKAKFGQDVGNLNRVWSTSYKTFEEVLPADGKGLTAANRVVWWEWRSYVRETFNDWHRWLADIVHEAWPEVCVYAKPMAGGFAGSSGRGVDFELFAEWSDVNSCDTFLNYKEGEYLCTWLDAALNYDLLTSLKRTTIVNAENHIIRDAEGRDIPYEYVYTTLFQQYMHGLSLSSTWSWMEQREDTGYNHVKGLFAERPMCVAALNQATMDANRLIYQIKAFFDERPRVAILYSPTAMIKDTQHARGQDNYDACGIEVYKQLSFMGRKIGFLSERQIAEGRFGDVDVVIVPSAAHVLKATAEGLREFVSRGHVVIAVGNCLGQDQYDQPLEATVPMVRVEWAGESAALAEALKKAVEAKLGRLPIEVAVGDGVADGVEWRIVRYEGGFLLNLVNYNKQPRQVTLNNRSGAGVDALDIITFQKVNDRFVLEPLRPMLIRLSAADQAASRLHRPCAGGATSGHYRRAT